MHLACRILQALIAAGFLEAAPDLQGSNNCNALHLAAWGGHADCVRILCEAVPHFAGLPNKWREFPELRAFNRACELRLVGQEPISCEVSAVCCLRTRTGNPTLGLEWFQDQALEGLRQGLRDAASTAQISAGTRPQDILEVTARLTPAWRATSLHANFVDLRGSAFQQLMVACSQGPFLQTLHLECCGLDRQDLRALRTFLENGSCPLKRIDLGGNLLGDTIVDIFCSALFTVKDIGFDNVGMTHEGWAQLSQAMRISTEQGCSRTDVLRLARNDLSENGACMPSCASFGSLIQLPGCTLRQAFLDHTRLQLPQLQEIVAVLSKCCLTVLSCHGLAIPEEWARPPHGRLFSAIKDPRCSIKKLHLDRGEASDMSDKLWSAIKLRDAEKPRSAASNGQGSKGKGGGKSHEKGVPLSSVHESCRSSESTFDLREPFKTCPRALYWDVRRSTFRADFVTENMGVLSGVVLASNNLCLHDVGRIFKISLQLQRVPATVDKDQKAKDLVLHSVQASATATATPFLESCRVVFLREATREVLLLRSRLSPAGFRVSDLIKKVLPDVPAGMPSEIWPQVTRLLSELSDVELHAILESTNADMLKDPFTTSPFFDATSVSRHRTLVGFQAWRDFAEAASKEKLCRDESNRIVSHNFYRMLNFRPSCQLQSGGSVTNQLSFDDPLIFFLAEIHRAILRSPVHIPWHSSEQSLAPVFIDVSDKTGCLAQRLFIRTIPEGS
ncbi:unnamed protein product [Polarella glacialis]|uniref:Uncharacterized protein n=2 Tax=Polarella glacialis TaxID=89957 RepID=A0A813LYX3_POLGL|nr:unnamed protein product [Polarella glacialis]